MAPQLLLEELDFVFMRASDSHFGGSGLVCRKTGQVFYQCEDEEFSDPDLPDDLDQPDAYAEVPHKRDLNLGHCLVFAFVADRAPQHLDTVHAFFARRGAYDRLKDLLDREGLLDAWHEYEDQTTRRALSAWATDQGFQIVEGKPAANLAAPTPHAP